MLLHASRMQAVRWYGGAGGGARGARPDIGARARELQTKRMWTMVLGGTAVAGFVIVILNSFQENLMFYITPTQALEKFGAQPAKSKFRLGGLVLEGSVRHFANSTEMEFVVTDLANELVVRYRGALPDLFREGHSVVAEGFLKPWPPEQSPATAGASGGIATFACEGALPSTASGAADGAEGDELLALKALTTTGLCVSCSDPVAELSGRRSTCRKRWRQRLPRIRLPWRVRRTPPPSSLHRRQDRPLQLVPPCRAR
eukprot:jgi/Mesen1/5138/ME000255S04114